MKIVILAAGIGSRLKPLTQNTPKSLLSIDNGVTVLERTINIINRNCKVDIIVVTGYYKEKIDECLKKYENCKSIYNPFYRITNSIASLWFAREYLDDDTIIMNADVVVEEKLFKFLLDINSTACILYDSSISKDADYKVLQEYGKTLVMGKELSKFSGEYVGISKFNKQEINRVKDKIEKMINNELFNEWYETALVDMIFSNGFNLEAIDVSDYSWTEIDNVDDLIKAKKIFLMEKNKL